MQDELPRGSKLYLDGNRGVYIPQNFCEMTDLQCVEGVTQEDWDTCLLGPDEEWYWEAWMNIEDNAVLTEPDTRQVFTLYQDGDLWLIPATA